MRIRRQGVVVMEPPKEMTVGNLVAEAKQILADKKLASIERRESRPLTNKDTYRELYEKWLANGKGKIPTCRRCGDAVLHWNEPAHVCEGFKPKFVEHDDAWHEKQEARRAEIRASNQDRPKKCIVCHEVIRDYDDACYHEEHCCSPTTCPVDATGTRTTTLSLATTTDTSATRTNQRKTTAKVTMMAMTATDYIYRRMLNPMPKPFALRHSTPQRRGCTMKELKLTNHDNRPPSGHDPDLRVPAALNTEELDAMPYLDMNAMLWFSDRWWWFPGARIGADSWEFEWRDGKALPAGSRWQRGRGSRTQRGGGGADVPRNVVG